MSRKNYAHCAIETARLDDDDDDASDNARIAHIATQLIGPRNVYSEQIWRFDTAFFIRKNLVGIVSVYGKFWVVGLFFVHWKLSKQHGFRDGF